MVLDRNGNGFVDDGSELFGNATSLLSGDKATIGFIALQELDKAELGGNLDGAITKSDQQFRKLRLWTDKNRNGLSEPRELRTLSSLGVMSISLTFTGATEEDEFGNGLYFHGSSEIKVRGRIRTIETIDVFFKSGS